MGNSIKSTNILNDIPKDILHHEILPTISKDCIYVCKEWYERQIVNIPKDSRVESNLSDSDFLSTLCEKNNYRLIQVLVTDERVRKSQQNVDLLKIACRSRNINIVREIMKLHVNFVTQEYCCLCVALENGDFEIAELLLSDPRVHPNGHVCNALELCCSRGYLSLVKLLLQDVRIDPSYPNNSPLIAASQRCNKKIIKLLLDDPRIDISLGNYRIFVRETLCDNSYILRYILNNPRFDNLDFSPHNNTLMGWAGNIGDIDIMRSLLSHPEVNPNYCCNHALYMSIKNRWISIMELLLSDPRINLETDMDMLIRISITSANMKFIDYLLENKIFERDVLLDTCMRIAIEGQHHESKKILSSYRGVSDSKSGIKDFFCCKKLRK